MKRTYLIIFVGFIIILAALSSGVSLKKETRPSLSPATSISSLIAVSQKITVAKTKQSAFESNQIEKGKTALDLLNKTAQVKMKGTGKNAFITEINGVAADEKKKEYWAFYINGKLGDVGAGSYILKEGDKIEWKKESF